MICPKCGNVISENVKECPECGTKLSMQKDGNEKSTNDGNERIPFYFRMWFIFVVFLMSIFFVWGIPAIALFVIRLVKFPKKRKQAWIAVCAFIGAIVIACIPLYIMGTADVRAIDKLVKEQKYDEALQYVDNHYDASLNSYYEKRAEIYEAKGDFDGAAQEIIKLIDNSEDLMSVNLEVKSRLKEYKEKCHPEISRQIDAKLSEIDAAVVAKEEAERKAAEEKAAQEAAKEEAERRAAEEKAAQEEAERKAAEEKAAKEEAERKATEEKAAKEEAERKAVEEKAAKEAEEKSIVDNAKRLGVDLVMESHNSLYEGKYYKTEGTVESIKGDAYLIRYLSTVPKHKRMYKLWVRSSDTSNLYEGENVMVVGKYVGFAESSSVPTIDEYKINTSQDSFYATLSQKSKKINYDVSFNDLLRYGEYQDYVYVEGTVFAVYDSCINIEDRFRNFYVIFDERANPGVVLQGDYVRIYGQYEGIDKSGYVWPKISWLIDGG